MRRPIAIAKLVAICLAPVAAHGGITDILNEPRFRALGLAPMAPALANTVASTYPVASASAGVTYVYDPAVDTFVRRAGVAGAVLGGGARPAGRGVVNF